MKSIVIALAVVLAVYSVKLNLAIGETFDAKQVIESACRPLEEFPPKELLRIPLTSADAKLVMSGDGRVVATYGESFQAWNTENGKTPGAKSAGKIKGPFNIAVLSENGRQAILATPSLAWVIEVVTGKIVLTLPSPESPIISGGFLDGEKEAFFVTHNATYLLANIKTGKVVKTVAKAPTQIAKGVGGFSSDARWLFSLPESPASNPRLFFVRDGAVNHAEFMVAPGIVDLTMSDDFIVTANRDAQIDIQFYRLEAGMNFRTYGFNGPQIRTGLATQQRGLSITSDGKHWVRVGQRGIETGPLGTDSLSLMQPLKIGGKPFAIAGDARKLALKVDNEVVIYELHSPADSPSAEFVQMLGKLLRENRFGELDALGDLLADDESAFMWSPGQTKYDSMSCLLVSSSAPGFTPKERTEQHLKWLEKNPKSSLVKIVLAQTALSIGNRARGDGLAFTVSPENAQIYQAKMQEAFDHVKPLLADPKVPLHVYSVVFQVAKAQSWTAAECEPYVEKLLKRNPKYFSPWKELALKLMRRWGGAEQEDEKLIARVSDAIGGKEGDAVYARLASLIAQFETPEDFYQVSKFNRERIMTGWLEVESKFPNFGTTCGLYMANYSGDFAEASKIAARIQKENRVYGIGLLPSALTYEAILQQYSPPQ